MGVMYTLKRRKLSDIFLIAILVCLFLAILSFIFFSENYLSLIIISLIVFLVIYRRPKLGLFIAAFFLPLIPRWPEKFGTANFSISEFILLVVLFNWILFILLNKQFKFKRTKLDILIIAFLVLASISFVFSSAKIHFPIAYGSSLDNLYPFMVLLNILEFVLVYFFVVNTLEKRDIRKMVVVFLVSLGFVITYALYQKIFLTVPRIYSTFGHPNLFSSYLLLFIPLAICLFFYYRSKITKSVLFLLLALSIISLFYSYSRGGLIIVLFIAPLAIFSNKKARNKNGVYLLTSIILLILILFSLTLIMAMIKQEKEWHWYESRQCETDFDAKCYFSIENNALELYVNPAGNSSEKKWMGSVYVRKDMRYLIGNETRLRWVQFDKEHSGHIHLILFTTRGYKELVYSACAPNHWYKEGWVAMPDEAGCDLSFHDRNILYDYSKEYNDSVPYSIEAVMIGHFYDEDQDKDIGMTVYNLSIVNVKDPYLISKDYLGAKFEYDYGFKTSPLFRIFGKEEKNINRMDIYKNSISIFKNNSLGIGLGRFRIYYNEHFGQDIHHAHNVYLQFLVEIGIIALIVFILVVFWLFKTSFTAKTKNEYLHSIKTGLLLGIIALLVQGMVEYPFYSEQISILFWAFVGIIMVINDD